MPKQNTFPVVGCYLICVAHLLYHAAVENLMEFALSLAIWTWIWDNRFEVVRVNEDLIYEILAVVEEIPEGCVATYGQIARLIDREKNARLVGRVLGRAERYGEYPCHRVVNHAGRLVPGWSEQADLLRREGVELKANGCVDMAKYRWEE